MRGHNICFCEKYEKLSLNYPQYPLLPRALTFTKRNNGTISEISFGSLDVDAFPLLVCSPKGANYFL